MKPRTMLRAWAFVWSMGGLSAEAVAQELTISGAVRDANTHQEIRDAGVYLKGTKQGTTTDVGGRFKFGISRAARNPIIVIRHVGYEPREIPLDSLRAIRYVYLQPRVIALQGVEVEEEAPQSLEIEKDLPQSIAVLESKDFEIRGYVDAGDLLRTDHSVQVEEELSGKKTVSIRGGNPDEVVVLYNGIKMNSSYNNQFDLSLVDLEGIDRFEIIKGSNTSLYGPEAFAGVINIVPLTQRDYTIRLQQRFGTYRSGNWGLHLYKDFKRVFGGYSFARGGALRSVSGQPNEKRLLENSSRHHTATMGYHFSLRPQSRRGYNTLTAMYVNSDLDYENGRDNVTIFNVNQLVALRYTGGIYVLKGLDLSAALRSLDEQQSQSFALGGDWQRGIDDRALRLDLEKHFKARSVDVTLAYQLENGEVGLKDLMPASGTQQSPVSTYGDLTRRHHGLVAIAQFHGDGGSDFFRTIDVDFSFRHDRVSDEESLRSNTPDQPQQTVATVLHQNDWQRSTFKFAFQLFGYRNDLACKARVSFGRNTKFPTLLQQISRPSPISAVENRPSLNPEQNRSVEIGVEVTRDMPVKTSIDGWRFSADFFHNYYDNKFRMFSVPDDPRTYYDNVQNARISGFETALNVFLLRKKLTLGAGLARYSISEKSAFPFKSDFKATFSFNVDNAGYSFVAYVFRESEQTGLVPQFSASAATPVLFTLPGQTNIDLHLSKEFELGKLKLFANASGRNLLNNDLVLRGLALRDRRYYLTVGAQY